MRYYVYILTCDNHRTLYIGVTNDLSRRIYEHKNGIYKGFTKRYHLHKLIYFEETTDVYSALSREKQLKSWSRKRKEALINSVNPEWDEICIN